MDRRCLRLPHDVERNGLMCVAAQTSDLQIPKPCIEGITESRRRLRRALEAEHAHVPSLAGQLVSFLARRCGTFGSHADRMAEEVFPGLGGHVQLKRSEQRLANRLGLGDRNTTRLPDIVGMGRLSP